MNYKTIIPATDWFFVVDAVPPQTEQSVWPLAAWALTDDDRVIGLVGLSSQGGLGDEFSQTASLASVPPLRGTYKPRANLTPEQHCSAGLAYGSPGA